MRERECGQYPYGLWQFSSIYSYWLRLALKPNIQSPTGIIRPSHVPMEALQEEEEKGPRWYTLYAHAPGDPRKMWGNRILLSIYRP